MAEDKEKTKSKKGTSESKRKLGFFSIATMIVVSLAMIIFTQMTFVLLIIGILPTFVAFYVDVSPGRFLFQSVMACNLSGVLPFVAELFAGGNQTSTMQMMIGDMQVLLAMYMAAGLGWVLHYFSPYAARLIITSINQRKINRLQESQARLLEEWGPDIKLMPEDN